MTFVLSRFIALWRSDSIGSTSMPTWKRITDPEAGFLYSLSDSLAVVDWRYPNLLQVVNEGEMVIVSDYSGQHKGATHEAYSFLVTTNIELEKWLPIRTNFRRNWLKDGRRISFKQLREPARKRALLPFLAAAEILHGNIITFLVDQRIKEFMSGGEQAFRDAFPDCCSPETQPGTIEKMHRLASFLALIIAGLRKEGQRSWWISDHDETLATFERREQFARLATYLTVGLTKWRRPADLEFATTLNPRIPYWAEDVAAVPDLIAGAFCKLSSHMPTHCGTELWTRRVDGSKIRDDRAVAVGNWMATTTGNLRSVLLRLELVGDSEVRSSAQLFAGSRPSALILRP